MPLTLVFLHGWGFDAGFWTALRALLPQFACLADDRGYFGQPKDVGAEGPVLLVGHSLGVMRALADPPAQSIGLVAINGFDRFADRGDGLGTPPRVLDRMMARMAADPARVVEDFRRRCGCEAAFPAPDAARLIDDLALLRDGDLRAGAAAFPAPILSLQGGDDPLLPPALRRAVFAGARAAERTELPGAGHLLPITHGAWCAERIASFAAQVRP